MARSRSSVASAGDGFVMRIAVITSRLPLPPRRRAPESEALFALQRHRYLVAMVDHCAQKATVLRQSAGSFARAPFDPRPKARALTSERPRGHGPHQWNPNLAEAGK